MPSSPSRIARSVQWPRPVSASEPYSCAETCAVRLEQAASRQQLDEAPRGVHRPHGVRTRGADADLENIENAETHGRTLAMLERNYTRPASGAAARMGQNAGQAVDSLGRGDAVSCARA